MVSLNELAGHQQRAPEHRHVKRHTMCVVRHMTTNCNAWWYSAAIITPDRVRFAPILERVYDDIIQILFGYIYDLQNSQVLKTLQSKVINTLRMMFCSLGHDHRMRYTVAG
jgi:hypothetical protein